MYAAIRLVIMSPFSLPLAGGYLGKYEAVVHSEGNYLHRFRDTLSSNLLDWQLKFDYCYSCRDGLGLTRWFGSTSFDGLFQAVGLIIQAFSPAAWQSWSQSKTKILGRFLEKVTFPNKDHQNSSGGTSGRDFATCFRLPFQNSHWGSI